MFEGLNKVRTVREGVETKGMEFKKLKEFAGTELFVDGFFYTTGRYGKQLVVVANGYCVNMPSRCVKEFEKIENDSEMLNAVLNGSLKLTDIEVGNTKNGETVFFKYTDC